ncbi:MAG: hypothetical protein KDJ54_06450 [Candidatus Competibacteraceae bacterium]|nr:hypothetical protein [Candidatus Competibacteraceae bacterium]
MTALADGRNTPYREGSRYSLPVAAAKTLYPGALAALDASGNVTPGATATGLKGIGRVEALADNGSGAAGDIRADIRPGIYRWENSTSTDEITAAEVGDTCYMVDDQTVAKTDGGSTRSPAGTIIDVDDLGVWVASGLTI